MRGWFLFFGTLEAVHIQYVHAFICMLHLIMWDSFVVLVIDLQGYFGAFVANSATMVNISLGVVQQCPKGSRTHR